MSRARVIAKSSQLAGNRHYCPGHGIVSQEYDFLFTVGPSGLMPEGLLRELYDSRDLESSGFRMLAQCVKNGQIPPNLSSYIGQGDRVRSIFCLDRAPSNSGVQGLCKGCKAAGRHRHFKERARQGSEHLTLWQENLGAPQAGPGKAVDSRQQGERHRSGDSNTQSSFCILIVSRTVCAVLLAWTMQRMRC